MPSPSRRGEQNDRRLSDTGRAAAAALAAELSAEPIAAIYSSPCPRARETVEPLAAAFDLPIAVLDDLRERLLSPGVLDDWLGALRRSFADPDYALPGGESSRQAGERVGALLARVAGRHRGQTVVCASHGNCWRWRSSSAILRSASSSDAACRCRRCTGWLCVERPVVPSSRGG
jgi:2,3-bisphosphoglycerate-dependent phosphoglycerate mutase